MRTQFLDAYRAKLAMAYPIVLDGKALMRFPRIFIVAQV
jgi:trans-aconitate 2-methyltransferase